ncbi:hypothetical protein [Actinomadura violacea]|uniref:Uncharacterized protein n=1 Tax=Actinomadura violacea TaxID=2819934 RepID=A0ABS3RY17_9ACTN|nr:hypothetical protein [Actinomadura violacea]MBO2461653.1 hypothetical protein [Actinomadura violacea]
MSAPHTSIPGDQMAQDPLADAERAAFCAYGTMRTANEVGKLKAALVAHRNVLAAHGLLRDETTFTPDAAAQAAKLLAGESGMYDMRAGQWQMLLYSTAEVQFAYAKALAQAQPEEEGHRRDLTHARRILLTIIGERSAEEPADDTPAASATGPANEPANEPAGDPQEAPKVADQGGDLR